VSLAKVPSDEKIMLASVLLGQDCIAIRYPDGSGKLIGPAALSGATSTPSFSCSKTAAALPERIGP